MGCKNTKETSDPTVKKGGKQKASSGLSPERVPLSDSKYNGSPSKRNSKIKEINPNDLKKHTNASDIFAFIKGGNLPMVHGLINHLNLGLGFINLRGYTEEFAWTKTEKTSVKDWNPLHLAVAYKKIDILRYFLQDW
jgi:hypothetical protein